MVILSEIIGKTLKFEIVNPTGRKIVIVKEVPISDVADIETFITDPNNDYYEVKRGLLLRLSHVMQNWAIYTYY